MQLSILAATIAAAAVSAQTTYSTQVDGRDVDLKYTGTSSGSFSGSNTAGTVKDGSFSGTGSAKIEDFGTVTFEGSVANVNAQYSSNAAGDYIASGNGTSPSLYYNLTNYS